MLLKNIKTKQIGYFANPQEGWGKASKEDILKVNLEKAKQKKENEINNQRDINKNQNIVYKIDGKDYEFQRDIISQLSFINSICSMDDIAVQKWITADNSIVSISKSDLISICAHIKQRDDQEFYQARKRKDAILAMDNIEDVESYDITTVYEN